MNIKRTATLLMGLALAAASAQAQLTRDLPRHIPHGHDSTWIKEIRTPQAPPQTLEKPCTTPANTMKTLGCPAPDVGSFSGEVGGSVGGIAMNWTYTGGFRKPSLPAVLKEAEYLMRQVQPQIAIGGYTIDDYPVIKTRITESYATLAVGGNTSCTSGTQQIQYATVGTGTGKPVFFGTQIPGQAIPFVCQATNVAASSGAAPFFFLRYCGPTDGQFASAAGCAAQNTPEPPYVDWGGCNQGSWQVGDVADSCEATGSANGSMYICKVQNLSGRNFYYWQELTGGITRPPQVLCR